jgi:hypothetical protein
LDRWSNRSASLSLKQRCASNAYEEVLKKYPRASTRQVPHPEELPSLAVAQVLRLQTRLGDLHATDLNSLRRAYTTLAQHVQVFACAQRGTPAILAVLQLRDQLHVVIAMLCVTRRRLSEK